MRPGDLTRRPARSWNPEDPTARLSDDQTVFEASVSALGGLGSALLRLCAPSRPSTSDIREFLKTPRAKIPFARGKKNTAFPQFPQTGDA